MTWSVEYLNGFIEEEFQALPGDIRARFVKIVRMISSYGLHQVGMPYVRHVEGKIWEMRASGRDGIARGMYVTAKGRRVVLVHVFMKKTQKTPREEIKKALANAQEVDDGQENLRRP
jgi:phage-related protein